MILSRRLTLQNIRRFFLLVRTWRCTSIPRRPPLLYHLTKAVANGQVSPTILNTLCGRVAPHCVYSHVVNPILKNRAYAVPRHMGTRRCFPAGLLGEYSAVQTRLDLDHLVLGDNRMYTAIYWPTAYCWFLSSLNNTRGFWPDIFKWFAWSRQAFSLHLQKKCDRKLQFREKNLGHVIQT